MSSALLKLSLNWRSPWTQAETKDSLHLCGEYWSGWVGEIGADCKSQVLDGRKQVLEIV